MANLNEKLNDKEKNNININSKIKEDLINPCRCPKCFLIPLISLYQEENKLKLKFICPNSHEYNEEYDSLYIKSKKDFEKIECKIYNNKKIKNKLYLCNKCNNFFVKNVRMIIEKIIMSSIYVLMLINMIQNVKCIIKI